MASEADEPLLVVDVQRGFINDYTRHIPARVARLIETHDYQPVLFTRFINVPDSPYQRLLHWVDVAQPPGAVGRAVGTCRCARR